MEIWSSGKVYWQQLAWLQIPFIKDNLMITHGQPHAHERAKGKPSHQKPPWWALHRDWRTWVVIGLMLAAMGIYVLSLDDSVQPGGAAPGGVPAAAAPAGPSK